MFKTILSKEEYKELEQEVLNEEHIEDYIKNLFTKPEHQWLLNTTLTEINKETEEILNKLGNTKNIDLKYYYWVQDYDQIFPGKYIRWVVLDDKKIDIHVEHKRNKQLKNILDNFIKENKLSKRENKEFIEFLKKEIHIDKPEWFITKGAVVININEDTKQIYCRTVFKIRGRYQYFYINFNDHIIFQKLTPQERLILEINEITQH